MMALNPIVAALPPIAILTSDIQLYPRPPLPAFRTDVLVVWLMQMKDGEG